IHIDIDEAEIGKNIRVDLGVHGDAKAVLERLTELVPSSDYTEWEMVATKCREAEVKEVIDPEIHPTEGPVTMGEVINTVADVVKDSAIVITDVGQNQMLGARYSRFNHKRSLITSGGLGTMGFGLPAAIGAKVASPDRQVCLFVGDGGLQMTIQELGTIMQEGTGVKIVVLNNNWLGNVRQWQQLFWKSRYSFTRLMNPDFKAITEAYGIKYLRVSDREHLVEAVQQMIDEPGPCLLEACVLEEGMVFPMIAPGKSVEDIMVTKDKLFVYGE
ncbi:MAG: acetolactate synthase large subunit, partial [Bacteroidales bacterium]|nr:acetolactate synthase large subunit [Bacteroidales bacterium]